MRDLTSEELVHVYGAGNVCNPNPCKPPKEDKCKESKPKKDKCTKVSSASCESKPRCY